MVTIFLITSFKDFLSLTSSVFCLRKGRNTNIMKYCPAASYQEGKKLDFRKKIHKTFGRDLNCFVVVIVSFDFSFSAWY